MWIATVALLFGFTGLLDGAAVIARAVFYVFAASTVLSLIFALFEEAAAPIALEEHEPKFRA
jgi:uncharacterized membrane protein YtjA (UPF0391 family)